MVIPNLSAMGSKGLDTRGRSSCIPRIISFSSSVTDLRLVPAFGGLLVVTAGPITVGTVVERRTLLLDHVEIDADFEEPDRGHDAHVLSLGFLGHDLDRGFQVVVGRYGQGEPEVVVGALPGIVVADPGMFVDFKSALVESLGIKRHGYESSLVAQPAGVEDRTDLPQHVLLLQFSQPLEDFILADVQLPANFQVRLFDQGERPLDDIQQLPVGDVHKL